jgi:hypothetical protein
MNSADERIGNDEWPGGHSSNKKYNYMVVEFNTGGANFIMGSQSASKRTAAAPAETGGSDTINTSRSLQQASASATSARPDKVAQAAVLINDPSYPSDAVMSKLASFLTPRL